MAVLAGVRSGGGDYDAYYSFPDLAYSYGLDNSVSRHLSIFEPGSFIIYWFAGFLDLPQLVFFAFAALGITATFYVAKYTGGGLMFALGYYALFFFPMHLHYIRLGAALPILTLALLIWRRPGPRGLSLVSLSLIAVAQSLHWSSIFILGLMLVIKRAPTLLLFLAVLLLSIFASIGFNLMLILSSHVTVLIGKFGPSLYMDRATSFELGPIFWLITLTVLASSSVFLQHRRLIGGELNLALAIPLFLQLSEISFLFSRLSQAFMFFIPLMMLAGCQYQSSSVNRLVKVGESAFYALYLIWLLKLNENTSPMFLSETWAY